MHFQFKPPLPDIGPVCCCCGTGARSLSDKHTETQTKRIEAERAARMSAALVPACSRANKRIEMNNNSTVICCEHVNCYKMIPPSV